MYVRNTGEMSKNMYYKKNIQTGRHTHTNKNTNKYVNKNDILKGIKNGININRNHV